MIEEVGSVLEISREENGADFKWRIKKFDFELLKWRRWLKSPDFSFAGREWRLALRLQEPDCSSDPVLLSLWLSGAASPTPVVRYRLGVEKAGGRRQEEDVIGSGKREPGTTPVDHSWLKFSELLLWRKCFVSFFGTLTFFARLRTGPMTDDEMKSLVELSQLRKKSATADYKALKALNVEGRNPRRTWKSYIPGKGRKLRNFTAKEEQNAPVAEWTSEPQDAANVAPAEAELNAAVAECEQSFHRLRTSNPHDAANVVSGPSGQQPSDECIICCIEAVASVLYPCGHMCMCYACAIKVQCREDSPQCPVCRKPIHDVIKVYK